MESVVKWVTVGSKGTKIPAWARRAALADDGTVFIPAAVCGSETDALLSAAYDGITVIRDSQHVYLPSDWLRQEYPSSYDLTIKIERRVREFFA